MPSSARRVCSGELAGSQVAQPASVNKILRALWSLTVPQASLLSAMLGIARGVILHVDDLGMCHGGNQAFLALSHRRLVTTGSMMVPCPWFREIADAAVMDATLDIGVHLTLTNEWEIERALQAGLRLTHIDAHMAAAMLPELLACHIALAMDYRVVPVLPKHIRFAPDPECYTRAVASLETDNLPLPDEFRGTLALPPGQLGRHIAT